MTAPWTAADKEHVQLSVRAAIADLIDCYRRGVAMPREVWLPIRLLAEDNAPDLLERALARIAELEEKVLGQKVALGRARAALEGAKKDMWTQCGDNLPNRRAQERYDQALAAIEYVLP